MTPEKIPDKQAYDALLKLATEAQDLCKKMNEQEDPFPGHTYKYTPFDHTANNFVRDVRELRNNLIAKYSATMNAQLSPNYHPTVSFVELMDKQAGEMEYCPYIISSYFKMLSEDKTHEALSKNEVLRDAKSLLPYAFRHGENPTFNTIIEKPKVLLLHAYTWYSYGTSNGYVSFSEEKSFTALEKLVNHLEMGDPFRTVKGTGWLIRPMRNFRNAPHHFYSRFHVSSEFSKTVDSFEFYKNGNFRVWFKDPKNAEALAQLITSSLEPVERNGGE